MNSEALGDNCKDWYRKLTLQISMHDLNTKLLHIRVKPFLVSKDQTTTKWVLLKAERQIFWRGFCKSYARFPKLLISFFAQLEASQQDSQVGRKELRLATRKSNNIDRNPKNMRENSNQSNMNFWPLVSILSVRPDFRHLEH